MYGIGHQHWQVFVWNISIYCDISSAQLSFILSANNWTGNCEWGISSSKINVYKSNTHRHFSSLTHSHIHNFRHNIKRFAKVLPKNRVVCGWFVWVCLQNPKVKEECVWDSRMGDFRQIRVWRLLCVCGLVDPIRAHRSPVASRELGGKVSGPHVPQSKKSVLKSKRSDELRALMMFTSSTSTYFIDLGNIRYTDRWCQTVFVWIYIYIYRWR